MRNPFIITVALTGVVSACGAGSHVEAQTAEPPVAGAKLFLDVHRLGPGKVTEDAARAAHQKDLAVQAKHGVKYLKYWVDVEQGSIFCLSEAPNAEAALSVHREAHGLMPESIEQVAEGK